MPYSKNTVYCLTADRVKQFKNEAHKGLNFHIATAIGERLWTPLQMDILGNVFKILIMDTGETITPGDLHPNYKSGFVLFTNFELDMNYVNPIIQHDEDTYMVTTIGDNGDFILMPNKTGGQFFTDTEAKEQVTELLKLNPDKTYYILERKNKVTAKRSKIEIIFKK